MKALDLIAVATLLLLSIGTFAAPTEDTDALTKLPKHEISIDPNDLNTKEIEALKNLKKTTPVRASLPAVILPDATDYNVTDIENLKEINCVRILPELKFGSPDDIDHDDIEALRSI